MESNKEIWILGVQKFKDLFEKRGITTRLYLTEKDFLYVNNDAVQIAIGVLDAHDLQSLGKLESFIEMTTLEFLNGDQHLLVFLVDPWLRDECDIDQFFGSSLMTHFEISNKIRSSSEKELCGLDIFPNKLDTDTLEFDFYRLSDQDLFLSISNN
jgi:hypothetical protein